MLLKTSTSLHYAMPVGNKQATRKKTPAENYYENKWITL